MVQKIWLPFKGHILAVVSPREYILTLKFHKGNEKNMGHLLIPKSLKVWKKVEPIGLGTFKAYDKILLKNEFVKN